MAVCRVGPLSWRPVTGREGVHIAAKRQILIADDVVAAARQLEQRLTSLGYEVAGIASSPTVFMIADVDEATLQQARITERHGYVMKPFTARALRATIELALCKRDAALAVHELEERFFSVPVDRSYGSRWPR